MSDLTTSIGMTSDYVNKVLGTSNDKIGSSSKTEKTDTAEAFSSMLDSAMKLLDETNTLANNADTAQMNFAMGYSDNTHDLVIAQQKASLSLQYTVAIKNQLLSSYKEIMNMQI